MKDLCIQFSAVSVSSQKWNVIS